MFLWRPTEFCLIFHWSDFSHQATSSCKTGWKCNMWAVYYIIFFLLQRWQSAVFTKHSCLLIVFLCFIVYPVLALFDSLDALTICLLKEKWKFGREEDREIRCTQLRRLNSIYKGFWAGNGDKNVGNIYWTLTLCAKIYAYICYICHLTQHSE